MSISPSPHLPSLTETFQHPTLPMPLCDKGSGLLETYVHWEDIEDVLSSALGVPCKIDPNRSLTQIGEGKVGALLLRIARNSGFHLPNSFDSPGLAR